MNSLSGSFSQRAMLRKDFLTKKSFGGAEIVLIDQQQCRCNFAGRFTLPRAIAKGAEIRIPRLKTYEQTLSCADTAGVDLILSETDPNLATRYNLSNQILLTNWSVVIPEMVYRARIFISPSFGRPVSFPILFSGRTDSGLFNIETCGVDRAS